VFILDNREIFDMNPIIACRMEQMKIAQQVGYWDSWWPGAESNQGRGWVILSFH